MSSTVCLLGQAAAPSPVASLPPLRMAKTKQQAIFAAFSLLTIVFVLYAIYTIDYLRAKIPVRNYAAIFMRNNYARNYTNVNDTCLDNRSAAPMVTEIVHQSWKTRQLPPMFANLSLSWKTCFPSWKHILWTDEDNLQLVRDYFPWFLPRYQALPHNIMRADAVRYMYMYVYGGVYADLDTECLKPFTHLLRNYSIVMGAMDGGAILPEGHTQNSFLYSAPGHPFWLQLLKYIYRHSNEGRPEAITGPNALMECIRAYRQRCKSLIKVYAPHYFNPFSWITPPPDCISRFRMTSAQFAACRRKFASSYVLQYHAHSWE